MAADIVTTILDEWLLRLTAELVTAYPLDDDLRARLVSLAPIQEDPTRKSCYVEIKPDPEKTREVDTHLPVEIGPGTRWRINFVLRGWTKMRQSREAGYAHTGAFVARVLACLLKHYQLDGVAADDGEYVTGCSKLLVDACAHHVIGGDREWYGMFEIKIHLWTERPNG